MVTREPKARDKVQCVECGRWFVSVANHVWHAHGMTADEYREAHDLLKANPLTGRDLSELRRELKTRELEGNPEALERLLRAGFRGNPENVQVPKSKETLARVGRERRERSARWWRQKLAAIGCGTLAEAADWAAERNCGWDEVAKAIGVSPAHVRSTARKQGVRIRRRVTEHQERMLKLAAQLATGPGSLWRVTDPPELGHWLSRQRQGVASGRRHPVHDRLDELDPDWHLSAHERQKVCSSTGCQEAAVDIGLCHAHAERHRRSDRRRQANAGVTMVTCQECGAVFRTIKAHLRQVHGMTSAEYQAKHGVGSDALVSPDVIAQRKQRTADLWPPRLAAVGWTTWQDAADWAVANDVGWPEIGARLGGSWRMAQIDAKAVGVTLPRRKRNPSNDRTDQEMHATAVALGYDGVPDLLERTRGLNDVQLADLLGVNPERARKFRRRHGIGSPGRQYPNKAEVEAAATARWRARFQAAGWASWQDAIDWALTCNGTWADVATHLGLSEALVRQRAATEGVIMPRRYGLTVADMTTPLHDQIRRQAAAKNLTARAAAAAEQRWQERFTAAGFTSMKDAVTWARDHDKTWNDLADRLRTTRGHVYQRARSLGLHL